MTAIAGGVVVTGFISPTDSADIYPTHDALYGKDGYRSVVDLTERNSIPALRRKYGMLVFVQANTTTYLLESDLTTWTAQAGIPPLANTQIFVGNASNIATSVALTLSGTPGTFALANTGVLMNWLSH